MRKMFYYLALPALVMTSCQNEEGENIGGSSAPLSEVRVKVGAAPTTRSTSSGEGTENTLNKTLVFAYADTNGDPADEGYSYMMKELGPSVSSVTFKLVKPKSKVFVLANPSYYTDAEIQALATRIEGAGSEAAAVEMFEGITEQVEKSYISDLNTSRGNFMMSGYAVAPSVVSTPYTMNVEVKRDLAKVNLLVKKGATFTINNDVNGLAAGTYQVKSVGRVVVHRSAQMVSPFAVSGTSDITYAIPFGYGEPTYVQDQLGPDGDLFVDPISNTDMSTGATDYTYQYDYVLESSDAENFVYNPFYVTPNAADKKVRGTILGLQVNLVALDAGGNPTGEEIARYYKARVSSGLESSVTGKNTHYKIMANVIGAGKSNPVGPEGPDPELDNDDLQITVSVQDWAFVISDQELE